MSEMIVMTEENRNQIIEQMTSPGEPFEVVSETIDGVAYKVFKNVPGNLKGLYALGMDKDSFISQMITEWFGEKEWDFMVYQDERYTFREAYQLAARLAWRPSLAYKYLLASPTLLVAIICLKTIMTTQARAHIASNSCATRRIETPPRWAARIRGGNW